MGTGLNLWDPGVPGGVPMSTEGDQDGIDEWLCFQWSLEDQNTNTANYIAWVNEEPVIQMLNYKGSTDNAPINGVKWLNLHQSSCVNNTGEDWVEVRDNWHLTASATPPTCTEIGFDSFGAMGATRSEIRGGGISGGSIN